MTTQNTYPSWDYKGETITLTKHGRFKFQSDETDGDPATYASLDDAKNAIDKALATRVQAARQSVALPALTNDGRSITITGIRRGTGDYLFKGAEKDYHTTPDYVDTPTVRALLGKKLALENESRRLGQLLQPATLHRRYRAYKNDTSESYAAALALMVSEYNDTLAKAEELRKLVEMEETV